MKSVMMFYPWRVAPNTYKCFDNTMNQWLSHQLKSQMERIKEVGEKGKKRDIVQGRQMVEPAHCSSQEADKVEVGL